MRRRYCASGFGFSTILPVESTARISTEAGEDALGVLNELSLIEQNTAAQNTAAQNTAAQITAIGAFARIGCFDRGVRLYEPIAVNEQCELLSPVGDVALGSGGAAVHAQVVLGLRDGSTRGGHLLGAEINPTLEVILRESPATLRRADHPELGIALVDLPFPAAT